MKQPFSVLLALLFILAVQCPASARVLAVFPLLDLTRDESGTNLPLTEYLRKEAVENGFTVLPESEVVTFMVRHRIRNLGILTSYQLNRVREELETDYVLLGTVCQLGEAPSAMVSLSLQLVRVADGAVAWSTIRDVHENDLISLLAISDPQSLNELYERYFSTLLDTIPSEMKEGGDIPPSVSILNINLRADHVKPGQKVEAEVRFYYRGFGNKTPSFLLHVGDKEYPVEQDGDARLLKVSWLAQEEDGAYPVDLICVLPSGERQINRLGEYTVDGTVPELIVNLLGTTIDNEVYFNRDLSILSRLKIPEALGRWEISVFDKDEQLVLLQDGAGQIPPHIYWNGMLSGAEEAEDGRYRIQVQVWDLAENMASAEGYANLARTRPKLAITVQRQAEGVHLQVDNEVGTPLAFWYLKVYEKNGGLLASQIGETLPMSMDFKMRSPESQEPLELIFVGRDRYGNPIRQKIDDLLQKENRAVEKAIVPESQWLENF